MAVTGKLRAVKVVVLSIVVTLAIVLGLGYAFLWASGL